MLVQYQLDLNAISPQAQEELLTKLDGFTWTGFKRRGRGVYGCYVEREADAEVIRSYLPDGCTMTKL